MSREILYRHRRTWDRKAVLADVYAVWFDALLARAPDGATVLEIGAGPGFLAHHVGFRRPDLYWIASELVETTWNDVVADALDLPFRSASVDMVVGLDVLHHLERPADFFRESARVLRPSGRLCLVEPWITLLSYGVYRFLHHESCDVGIDPWNPFPGEDGGQKPAMDGDSACVWRLVRGTSAGGWERLGLRPPAVEIFNGFAYLLSLGFKERSLLPRSLFPLFAWIDRSTSWARSWLGMRALISWERAASAAPGP